jgi:hypothetical protein
MPKPGEVRGQQFEESMPVEHDADSFVEIAPALLIVPLVLPRGHVWQHYVLAPADRWR